MFNFVRENKILVFLITLILLILEIEIFVHASIKSGDLSKIQVLNKHDDVIYESSATKLYEFNKYYFEENFGPLENYRLKRIKIERPFPFRAWLISSFGIPVGFILILGFIIKAWSVFFNGDTATIPPEPHDTITDEDTHIERIIKKVSSLNIFVLGFFIVSALFLYWVIPDMILFISRASIDTIMKFKWFFIAVSIVIAGIFTWFIYLKYLIAKKAIESNTEIEKMRLQIIHDTGYKNLDESERKLLIPMNNDKN